MFDSNRPWIFCAESEMNRPTTSSGKDEFSLAKRSAFHFLKIRDRSEKEIRTQLNKKKFSQETIEQTVQYLKKLELINDRQFARDWIRMRLQKPFGLRRIFFELKTLKGVSEEILKEEMSVGSKEYSPDEALAALVQKRVSKYKNLDEPKRKRRVFEYLIRRGFDLEQVKKVVERL